MALPSFLCPCMILSLNDQVTCGPPNQRTRSISPFRLREFRFSNSSCSRSISPRVHDPTTCVPFGSTVTIPLGIQGSEISTLNFLSSFLFFFPGADNPLTRVLFNPMTILHSRTSWPSTISNLSPSRFPREVSPRVHDPLTRTLLHDQRS
jgi:hypothetical protein